MKRLVTLHSIATACGLALALSAAMTIGGWQSQATPASSAPRAAPGRAAATSALYARIIPVRKFYLVASEQQKRVASGKEADAQAERGLSGIDEPEYRAIIFLIDTPESERDALDFIHGLEEVARRTAAFTVEVSDLRR
jgi:hypothetical protein